MDKTLAERIRSGENLVGTLHDFEDPHLIELIARCGVDFVVFCYEHGLKNESRIGDLIKAAELVGVPAIIRVGRREEHSLERFLDAGATGFLIPHITDKSRAEQVVRWSNYPPLGDRGAGFTRGWIAQVGEDEYQRKMRANRDLVLIGIIEDPEGVENIADIVQVAGFTGFMAGPGDLALAMGEETHLAPTVVEAVARVNQAVRESPSHALMAFCAGPERVVPLRDMGATVLLLHHDTHIIRDAYRGLLTSVRDRLPS